jgi:hypothetical protein
MTIQRVLREIGRHPIGGLWVLAQLLAAVVCLACFRPSGERSEFLWIVPVIALMFIIQLPTSALTHVATFALLSLPTTERTLLRILACQWLLTASVNYAVVVYGVPALSRVVETHWPFERTYFRRRSSSWNRRAG